LYFEHLQQQLTSIKLGRVSLFHCCY